MEYDQVLLDIIKYVYHYEVFEPSSFSRARMLLLDSFGCAMQSLQFASVRSFIGPYVPGMMITNGFRLPGTSFEMDPVKGAFDLGTLIRFLDHNDALGGADWGHPSDNLGAIVAVMDWLSRCATADGCHTPRKRSGPPLTIRTLLIAMIKAYEIEGCFQRANSFHAIAIDHTILVKIASTAVVSWIFGLSEDEALAALSQAWMDGHPLRTFRAEPNTISRKGWAAGDACMRAVHLVMLTAQGVEGAPRPLTVRRWGFYDALFRGQQFVFPELYGENIIHRTVIKVVACEGHALSAAEAALQLSAYLGVEGIDSAADIDKIEIRTQKPAMLIIDKKGDLTTAADRDHCMQYIVAVVLLKGDLIQAEDYQDDSPWASDPRVIALRMKIDLKEDERFTRDYYDANVRSVASSIKVVATNQIFERVVHYPVGHPDAPGTQEAFERKLRKNLSLAFSKSEIEDMQDKLGQDAQPVHEFIGMWTRNGDDEVAVRPSARI